MASTANDIVRLLNLRDGDSFALVEVFSNHFYDNEDFDSEYQDNSKICEVDPIQG